MDSFLFIGDYAKAIQSDNLTQIIGNNRTILNDTQLAAVEECASYLRQKYDVTQALQSISIWDKTKAYKAGQTVYLDASGYSATSLYALGVLVLQSGNIYKCTTAITVIEAFTPAHWTLVGAQYDKFYALFPFDIFDVEKRYLKGDQVFWQDKTYVCQVPSLLMDHQALLNVNVAGFPNVLNSFPDVDPVQWGAGTTYSVVTNTDILNATYWTPGDNRDQKLLMTCVDVALYHLHARISPKAIPDLRTHRYSGMPEDRVIFQGKVIYPSYSALGWLQGASTGGLTPQMALIQPKEGRRIRFGGNQKTNNLY